MENMHPQKKENAFLTFLKNLFIPNGKLRPGVIPSFCLIVLLGLSIWGGISAYTQLRSTLGSLKHEEIATSPEDVGIIEMERPEGVTNIALFGIDARNDSFRGLSDSIMIISVDANHNSIKIVSIMRDSLVRVDGYGYQKINAAYNLGGAQLAVKTLNQTFKMDITEYATVDFVSMAEIIDVVGGIEAELTEKEVANANKQIREMARQRKTPKDEIKQAGKQTLRGIQAVAYARIRKTATINGTNDDYGRTERQRHVMHQLFQKALALDINKYPAMINALLPNMHTSLTYEEIFDLAGILVSSGVEFQQARIPADGAIIDGGFRPRGLGSCVYYDLSYATDQLHAFIYEDISFEDYMEQNRPRFNRWYEGETMPQQEETPSEDPTTPTDPNTPPVDPNTPPVDPNTPPADPNTPPADPNTPPADPNTPPVDPNTPPADPNTPPADPNTPPTDPNTPPVDPNTPPVDPNTPVSPDTPPVTP